MQFAGVHFFTKRGYGEEMHAMSDSEEEEDEDLYQNYNNLQTVCEPYKFGILYFICLTTKAIQNGVFNDEISFKMLFLITKKMPL